MLDTFILWYTLFYQDNVENLLFFLYHKLEIFGHYFEDYHQ